MTTLDASMTHATNGRPTPRAGPGSRTVRACLEAASAAPSLHNSQPWLFRLGNGGIDVFADRRRLLGAIDPHGRELFISVAAAILNLRVAVLSLGWQPIAQVLPDPAEPDLVGRVAFGLPTAPDRTVRALAGAIPRRHTNRRPFNKFPVPGSVVDELAAAAAAEGAVLAVADPIGREAILSLVRAADDWQCAEVGYRDELTEWILPRDGRTDGVPVRAFGPRDERKVLPLRDFGLTQPQLRRRPAAFEPYPTVVVLSTVGDGRRQWVRAGQALERVLLTATVRGVASTPMSQAIEEPEIRQLVSDTARGRHAQMILRLGYGPTAPASPRRPLSEVLLPTRAG